jgi:5S rRNA maturation endonuclease (ribonuclease M5)
MKYQVDFSDVYTSRRKTPSRTSREEYLTNIGFHLEAVYVYRDEHGRANLRMEVWRNAVGEKELNAKQAVGQRPRRLLYRLPEVLRAIKRGELVWLVEGEKDAERLHSLGLVATTAPWGARHWCEEYTEQLAGARLAIVADDDEVGLDRAERLWRELPGVEWVLVAREGKDVSDHLDAGYDVDDLEVLWERGTRGDSRRGDSS